LIEEGVTGALCHPRDAASLADAMERLGRLPADTLAELGRAARSKVEREFGEEVVIDAYLNALSEVVRS
jgi:glycosyltransferase involved in cell wall biosynthesis